MEDFTFILSIISLPKIQILYLSYFPSIIVSTHVKMSNKSVEVYISSTGFFLTYKSFRVLKIYFSPIWSVQYFILLSSYPLPMCPRIAKFYHIGSQCTYIFSELYISYLVKINLFLFPLKVRRKSKHTVLYWTWIPFSLNMIKCVPSNFIRNVHER